MNMAVKTKLELYCRKHGFVETDFDKRCPYCYPRRDLSLAKIVAPAVGLGVALGLGVAEVIRWVF